MSATFLFEPFQSRRGNVVQYLLSLAAIATYGDPERPGFGPLDPAHQLRMGKGGHGKSVSADKEVGDDPIPRSAGRAVLLPR